MCCYCGHYKKPISELAPENDPQTLRRREGDDTRKGLSKNGVEDTNDPSISGSNNESTRSHRTSHISVLQGQFKDDQLYRKVPSSERNAHPTEVWAENGIPSLITTENGSLRDVAIGQSEHSNIRTSYSCQGSSRRPRSSETLRVPYIFEFIPFPGHTCIGRGTIPLGAVTVSVDENTENSHFKYDATFQRLLNDYNSRNRRVFATEPVELHHVTEVSPQSRVEFSASVQLVRDIREKKILVVTLLKRYPGCPECRDRGRLHDVLTS